MRAKPGECFQDSERELCKREPATEDRPAKPEPANQNARHSHGDASSLNGSFLAFSPRIHHRSLCLECGSHTQRFLFSRAALEPESFKTFRFFISKLDFACQETMLNVKCYSRLTSEMFLILFLMLF
ncbi:hypothetical protein RvY_02900-2 [Ramazzottius varieornatus]|uniref:Uncharacterized protein n=1 Tax=Ramazzottius varieornatus TaxID=947166 RepID=A0A1D1ULB6_RAMVA|nr:hypothetical protein RvY_02900-2 [Ramazzottius varieornatus]